MYVYIKSETNVWTVGFYDPQGVWEPENDYSSKSEAANRIHWLNGGRYIRANDFRDRFPESE
jgi:hypothetical protein